MHFVLILHNVFHIESCRSWVVNIVICREACPRLGKSVKELNLFSFCFCFCFWFDVVSVDSVKMGMFQWVFF